jgi:predicted metal-dependent hydrolase
MSSPIPEYDRRYLGGILFFNERDFFEAHEVWEDLWQECAGPERRFIQGLIQAAVALYHFGNGNTRGASKLYHSSRKYMEAYESPYLGLDHAAFWRHMERCFAEVLAAPAPEHGARLNEELIPVLALDPPPDAWPGTDEFETRDR